MGGCGAASFRYCHRGDYVCGPSSPFRRSTDPYKEWASYMLMPCRGADDALLGSDAIRDAALTRSAAFESGPSRTSTHTRA